MFFFLCLYALNGPKIVEMWWVAEVVRQIYVYVCIKNAIELCEEGWNGLCCIQCCLKFINLCYFVNNICLIIIINSSSSLFM